MFTYSSISISSMELTRYINGKCNHAPKVDRAMGHDIILGSHEFDSVCFP